MRTGEAIERAARAVADKLGLDRYDANLLPEEKVTVFEKIGRDRPNGKIAFVGDGINDAPVIARAEAVLKTLESGEQSGAITRLAEDLPLFAALATPKPEAPPPGPGPATVCCSARRARRSTCSTGTPTGATASSPRRGRWRPHR